MDPDKKKDNENSLDLTGEELLDQAEALIWALLDDQIEPSDLKRLESLMREHQQVRERYINCVQMHVDLQQHFDTADMPPKTDKFSGSPVLGSLGELRPGTDTWPPVSD